MKELLSPQTRPGTASFQSRTRRFLASGRRLRGGRRGQRRCACSPRLRHPPSPRSTRSSTAAPFPLLVLDLEIRDFRSAASVTLLPPFSPSLRFKQGRAPHQPFLPSHSLSFYATHFPCRPMYHSFSRYPLGHRSILIGRWVPALRPALTLAAKYSLCSIRRASENARRPAPRIRTARGTGTQVLASRPSRRLRPRTLTVSENDSIRHLRA